MVIPTNTFYKLNSNSQFYFVIAKNVRLEF